MSRSNFSPSSLGSNLLLRTDSYKASHWMQYPPGTQTVFSYIESRGGAFSHSLFFGLQAYLREYLSTPVTVDDVDEATAIMAAHGEPFNRAGWLRLVEKHGGRMPVRIRAVPEGSVVPVHNVLATIENTDPEFFWLTSYLETELLRAIWYPTTVATLSAAAKATLLRYLEATCDDPHGQIPFKLHDFGARGVSSLESAALGGLAHLVNFMGTDTVIALVAGRRYYDCDMAGFSIPAAEHSTITGWGRDRESDAYRNMVTQFGKPGALFAVVSDSYDIFNACDRIWGTELKELVVQSGATLVVRPDSGDPAETVLKVADILAARFGTATNSKGFRVLNNVRIIQGDGINLDSLRLCLSNLYHNGFSAENIAFGMGGGLLQQVNRDTMQWAMKCSAMQVDGEWRDVWKSPVGDLGKASKKGRLTLVQDTRGNEQTRRIDEVAEGQPELLETVFENGEILRQTTFDAVRARAAAGVGQVITSRAPL
ncbi:nicotinate phosphoribosyltransferase [Variovorax sp. dw_308]|uniref:nicotinate phosphoribosyltransferase n=1 Tax=Variovorax sp. dw_308 TaxID=2721546 RepID=UPI001C463084|nr:nicotinate phosphoribosyltransferase [Variovorax sp. dw_308]